MLRSVVGYGEGIMANCMDCGEQVGGKRGRTGVCTPCVEFAVQSVYEEFETSAQDREWTTLLSDLRATYIEPLRLARS